MMLIRSQDRKSLNPIGKIDIMAGNGFFYLENFPFRGAGEEIGRYETESRCLEILDEIEERLIIREGRSDVYNMPEK
jgi:hypothetical protein